MKKLIFLIPFLFGCTSDKTKDTKNLVNKIFYNYDNSIEHLNYLNKQNIKDSWGRYLSIHLIYVDKSYSGKIHKPYYQFYVRSAGPDKELFTKDDIVLIKDIQEEEIKEFKPKSFLEK